MNELENVGFTDTTAADYERFKGMKGSIDRLGFCHVDAQNNPVIMKSQVIYVPNLGYIRVTDETKSLGKVQPRYGSIVVQYATDKKGKVLGEVTPDSLTFKFWMFSPKKYDLLKRAHIEYPLNAHDILVTTVEETFQNQTFQVTQKALWSDKTLQEVILHNINVMKPLLENQLGMSMTLDQINEKLNNGSRSDSAKDADNEELSSKSTEQIIANL